MKFSTIITFIVALVGFTSASPVATPDEVVLDYTIRNFTSLAPASLLDKRAPTGTFKTWTTNPNTQCTGNAGQTIINPVAHVCYHHGSGTPQTFVRALWDGNFCQVHLYSQPGCNVADRVDMWSTDLTCWTGGWSLKSFKLVASNRSNIYDWERICEYPSLSYSTGLRYQLPASYALSMHVIESAVKEGHSDKVLLREAKKALAMAEEAWVKDPDRGLVHTAGLETRKRRVRMNCFRALNKVIKGYLNEIREKEAVETDIM
ncbi:hypothetical protein QBC38DRAFT_461843 [Podospora fimiseda]|uniref:Uncharacterized protein n=1 Tax=Podospora fimiseda TaxID=252190 RepID=A0AAN7BER8_9PEZI|nr:hypothetical protein QBC38DRAFT_461843 [Podospora fimiseda]